MADDKNNDLDTYLDNLGINIGEEESATPELPESAPLQPFVAPLVIEGDAAERCESFLVHLLLNIDPGYAVEVRRADEDEVTIDITGGDPGKIIGRGGRTLAALEYLTNAVINRDETRDKSEGNVRVNIDIGGYKARRDDRLRGEARKAAARVRKTGFAVELDPMNAGERRVIHMTLADDPSVRSESSGEGRDRRVVVKPVE